jgi:glycosyltransferase involved in cell wall biosynthesis
MKEISSMKVALVVDSMIAKGGSDRNIDSLLKIFPKADIYTAVFNEDEYKDLGNQVYTTFLQKPFYRKVFKNHYNIFTPWAFEMLDLREYEIVVSVSAGSAKGVITTMEQLHVCLLLTPPRTYWDKERSFRTSKLRFLINILTPFFANFYRIWDYAAAQRIDEIVTISKFIQKKVQHRYDRDSVVIYPGILEFWLQEGSQHLGDLIPKAFKKEYYLVVSRLYDYKKIDWAIKACKKENKKLVIVGDGPDMKYLKKIAGKSKNILFLGYISDEQLKAVYSNATAFIFPGIEDFGLVPVEAMACGCPVLAYNCGGLTETVVEGKTGKFFSSVEELSKLISIFKKEDFKEKELKERAQKFTEEKFVKDFTDFVEKKYEKFKNEKI